MTPVHTWLDVSKRPVALVATHVVAHVGAELFARGRLGTGENLGQNDPAERLGRSKTTDQLGAFDDHRAVGRLLVGEEAQVDLQRLARIGRAQPNSSR